MKRTNGKIVTMRVLQPDSGGERLTRVPCLRCGKLAPKGVDRPYCAEHAPYGSKLAEEIDAIMTEHGQDCFDLSARARAARRRRTRAADSGSGLG